MPYDFHKEPGNKINNPERVSGSYITSAYTRKYFETGNKNFNYFFVYCHSKNHIHVKQKLLLLNNYKACFS